jgi:hypothetical protein
MHPEDLREVITAYQKCVTETMPRRVRHPASMSKSARGGRQACRASPAGFVAGKSGGALYLAYGRIQCAIGMPGASRIARRVCGSDAMASSLAFAALGLRQRTDEVREHDRDLAALGSVLWLDCPNNRGWAVGPSSRIARMILRWSPRTTPIFSMS